MNTEELIRLTFPEDQPIDEIPKSERALAAGYARMHYSLYVSGNIADDETGYFEQSLQLIWESLSPQTQEWLTNNALDYGS